MVNNIALQSELAQLHDILAVRDYERSWSSVMGFAQGFLDGPSARIAGLTGHASLEERLAHADRSDPMDIDTIDIPRWRVSIEMRVIDFRCTKPFLPAQEFRSPFFVGSRLHLSMALYLTGRVSLARRVLKSIESEIGVALDRVSCGYKVPLKADALLSACHVVLDDSAEGTLPPFEPGVSLDEAWRQKEMYSNGANEFGYILGAPEQFLIPLELIVHNASLKAEMRDAYLSKLGAVIGASTYPEDPRLDSLDLLVSSYGY